LRTASISGV